MTINSLQGRLHATPFQPFTIRMADDRSLNVPHPDFIAVTGGGRTLFVGSDTEDRFSVIDLLLVTELEVGSLPNRVGGPADSPSAN